ncbi:MAG: hypothetical protein JRI36_06825 [Deltaproteobacteria bacterium]|nr:hypothetical protein [Deltaproteobacteria bacterium]
MNHGFCNPETRIPATDEARFHVLFLCMVRSVVEKYGVTMKTDPETYNALISIPTSKKDLCFDELEALFSQHRSSLFDTQGGLRGVFDPA